MPNAIADSTGERLFELSHDLLSVFDGDGRLVRVNPAFERMLGQPSAALAGRSIFDFVHPDDHAATAAALASVGTGAAPSAVETRWRGADGSFRWVSWLTAGPAAGAGATGDARGLCYAIGRDITERRLRDERLHFQAALLDAVGQAIIATDLDGTVTYWGRAAETGAGSSCSAGATEASSRDSWSTRRCAMRRAHWSASSARRWTSRSSGAWPTRSGRARRASTSRSTPRGCGCGSAT
jgi:PAS domain S-box-containing protein